MSRHTRKIGAPKKEVDAVSKAAALYASSLRKPPEVAYIPGKVPPEPAPQYTPHVIQIPIYRAVIVGERLTPSTDFKCGLWGLEALPRDVANTMFNGQYLYFRRVTTVDLTVFTHQ